MALISLADKGKICVAAASEVLQDIADGRGKYAEAKLKSLEKDAVELATHAEMLAKRLEAVDTLQQKKDAELLRQSGELARQEEELQAQKNFLVEKQTVQKQVLQEKESRCSSAETNLRSAERKLREANKKREENVLTSAKIGAAVVPSLMPKINPVVGTMIGGALGAGIGFAAFSREVKAARSHKDLCKEEVKTANSDVMFREKEISTIASKLTRLAKDIECLNQKVKDQHEKRGVIKKAIPVLRRAIDFWRQFRGLSKGGENRTILLRKIVEKATKEEPLSFEIVRSEGTQHMTSTFLEAWAEIETEAANGVDHIFVVEFFCARCKEKLIELPYLCGSDCICFTCAQH